MAGPHTLVAWEIHDIISTEVISWRVGYYDKPRSWEQQGPEPGDVNNMTRRYTDQKSFIIDRMPSAKPLFLQACSTKTLQLQKHAVK